MPSPFDDLDAAANALIQWAQNFRITENLKTDKSRVVKLDGVKFPEVK